MAVRDARHTIGLCHALTSERGEVSGNRLAAEVIQSYQVLSAGAREVFFDCLAQEFSPDPVKVVAAADAYRLEHSQANVIRLQQAIEPPRQELFRRCNMAPGGTQVLVEMRRQLLTAIDAHPEWLGIEADLAHLFRSWFNRGFLTLEQIDWRTSALVLERIIQYEAVHQIHGWHDLRRRLEADRRCYAFFSSALPEEPLIFIEVALTRGLPGKVQPLLDPSAPVVDPVDANCALFYSITNCQEGLRGVSMGNSLIKQVAQDLGKALPRVKTFATLSPIPGFTKWLVTQSQTAARGSMRLSRELAAVVDRLARGETLEAPLSAAFEAEVMRLCAYYLLCAKRGKAPLDSVERFHLANGARLHRLNWMGDTSPSGLARSLGLTVNYLYRLADVERHHEEYANGYRIAASREVEHLARLDADGADDPGLALGAPA